MCVCVQLLYDSGLMIPGCCPEGVLRYGQAPPHLQPVKIENSPYILTFLGA